MKSTLKRTNISLSFPRRFYLLGFVPQPNLLLILLPLLLKNKLIKQNIEAIYELPLPNI